MAKRFIDVSKWLHGEGMKASSLYRERDGKMCCIGQWGKTAGIPIEKLSLATGPQHLLTDTLCTFNDAPDYFSAFTEGDDDDAMPSHYALALMEWNDFIYDPEERLTARPIPLRQRMNKMQEIANRHGDEIIFLNVPEDQLSW